MDGSKSILQIAAKAAIINNTGKILIVCESNKDKNNTQIGRYGLVGGRLEPGESFVDGLRREVFEEVGLRIHIDRPLYVGEWSPVIHGVQYQIIALFMLCTPATTTVVLSSEHDKYAWIKPVDFKKYPMMSPDDHVVSLLAN